MRKTCAISFLVLAFVSGASAQIPSGGNIFFGYSFAQGSVFSAGIGGGTNMSGWDASAEGKYLPWLGVVADFDWHYGGRDFIVCSGNPPCSAKSIRFNASRHALLFGPRASVSFGRYTPFAEFLLGVAHQTNSGGGTSTSDTTFSTSIGGGLDYKLVKGLALRGQVDSIHTHFLGSGQNDLRISTGIVFRF